jgi:DNA invertase Pin-like site-specific DNA recombinase
MSKRAIGYIRVSTEEQAESGLGLATQRQRIEAWCVANGYELVNVFEEPGVSGKSTKKRKRLKAALDAACEHGAALIVYSLSRLARSTQDAIEIADRLGKAGADLVSLSESLDTTSAAGRMIFKVLAVLAEFERDLIAERTRAALAYKRGNGERIGTIPYGWRLAEDGVALEPVESEQGVVREIMAMRAERRSYRAIADELTRRGVPTKKGRTTWTHQAVASIVKRAGQQGGTAD